jgi:hypothetical protein
MNIKMSLSMLVLLGLTFFVSAQSRDSLEIKRYYEKNTIYWPGRRTYVKNDQHFPFINLKTEFEFSKEATWEFKEYKKDSRRSIICLVLAETLLLSSFLLTNDPLPSIGLIAAGGISLGFSIKFANLSFSHLSRAVWVHNRDVLLR